MNTQKYGIRYPFSSDNDENVFLDLNEDYEEGIKSMLLHIIFTQKGHRLRNPEFGTNLLKYIFEPSTETTLENVKGEIRELIRKWIPNIEFNDINIYDDEKSEHGKIITINYSIIKGKIKESRTVGLKI